QERASALLGCFLFSLGFLIFLFSPITNRSFSPEIILITMILSVVLFALVIAFTDQNLIIIS
ncbi:MAG: hypothetical protein ACFFBD_14125, partial [Candidatus Hodarchaeota archaeon]